jgi:5-methylcytosine-specific restriction protein A
MLSSYLESKGFQDIVDKRKLHGNTESQTIHSLTATGEQVVMRVRLCWRRDRNKRRAREYSAAQLMARIKDDDWEGSIKDKIAKQRAEGVTHLLLVQRDEAAIRIAALVPLSAVLSIWCSQRNVSTALIKRGELGRRKKNHAMNGSSPTLWLLDEAAPSVASQLWDYPGVIDIARIDNVAQAGLAVDDTYDDLPGMDLNLLGAEGASVRVRQRSHVARDSRVRAAVVRRAGGVCEHKTCAASRSYPEFLDVHHVLGAAVSDRVFNCVAICPNCHREAHFAPNRQEINASLLAVAQRKARLESRE